MYDIGILGGMGSKATALLFQLIVENTGAICDQDFLNIIVANKADIPDRTAFLLNQTDKSPLPKLKEGLSELTCLGASNILIPCNTSHYFYDEMARATDTYILNMVSNSLSYIKYSLLPKKVIILGTLGLVQLQIYDKNNSFDLDISYPSTEECNKIHQIIYNTKNSTLQLLELATELDGVISDILAKENSATVLLACTELSVLKPLLTQKENIVDALELLALAAIYLSSKKPLVNKLCYDYKLIRSIALEEKMKRKIALNV